MWSLSPHLRSYHMGNSMKNTFDFDFKNGEFRMKNGNPVVLTGIDALKLWIEKTIRTQLNRYSIYKNRQYGANIEDLVIGKTYGMGLCRIGATPRD